MKNLRVTEKQRDAVMGVGQTPGMMQGGAVPGRPGAMGMVAGRPGGGPMGMVPGRPGGMGPPPAAMPMRGQPNKGGVQTDSTHQFLMQLSATRTLPGDFASGYTLQEGVDYLFGNTKLFIRHPKHFFALEYMRTVGLGIFVSRYVVNEPVVGKFFCKVLFQPYSSFVCLLQCCCSLESPCWKA